LKQYPEHIDELIAKVLTSEATSDEGTTLNEWLKEHPDNQIYFNQIESIYHKSATPAETIEFDTEAAWKKVSITINKEPKVVPITKPANRLNVLRIAAVVVTLFGLGAVLFLMKVDVAPQFAIRSGNQIVGDTLPDKTLATLNKGSELTYELDEKKKIRKAVLKGEAFFEISEDKENQFLVYTNEVMIKDVGTAFNVRSFDDNDTISVSVKDGEVIFYTNSNKGISLMAGETGYYLKSTKVFAKANAVDENASSYADREFRFRNTPMRKVVTQINAVYETKIRLSDKQLEHCRITVNFKEDDIETIASVIAETMGWTVERSNNQLVLFGSACQ
jgi:ferric-dicitrate binding protein FerR (iron transport regulator)